MFVMLVPIQDPVLAFSVSFLLFSFLIDEGGIG